MSDSLDNHVNNVNISSMNDDIFDSNIKRNNYQKTREDMKSNSFEYKEINNNLNFKQYQNEI